MGLLNDAIREHLELMRQHGAADEEVERLEHEALGPVRRRGAYAPDPDDTGASAAAAAAPAGPAPIDEPPTEILSAQPVTPEPTGHEPEVEEVPPLREGPAAVPMREPVEPEASTTAVGDDELWLEDEPEAPAGTDAPGQETTAFSAADVTAARGEGEPAAEAGGEDDVLEETPEFLQETPEHERLWFEQRPPRGFDFDQ